MEKIIRSNLEKGVGCHRYAPKHPVETMNLTYQNATGNIKVDVDDARCIVCGSCIQVCQQGTRSDIDDLTWFFDDLACGIPLSLKTALLLKSPFPAWKKRRMCLKQKGVRKRDDVSSGADIAIRTHLRYLETCQPPPLIARPCPVTLSYYGRYRHDLPDRLSPCITKSNEGESTGMIDYPITLARLQEYRDQPAIDWLDMQIPIPACLKERSGFGMGNPIQRDKAKGQDVA